MAYYTVAHFMQGDVYGSTPGELGIKADQLNEDTWDYIFLDKGYDAEKMTVPEEKLAICRKSFSYWYPMDLRVSAKDLIKNHLIFSLFNHNAVWKGNEKMPRAFFCNGMILIDRGHGPEKMSKSLGNFYTVEEIVAMYGADATRIALADAGDTLDDANFVLPNAENAILKLSHLHEWINQTLAKLDTYRTGVPEDPHLAFVDKYFEANIKHNVYLTYKAFECMKHREALKYGYFELQRFKEDYRLHCGGDYKRELVLKYIKYQLIVLYPITPHFSEIIWRDQLSKLVEISPEITVHLWPVIKKMDIDFETLDTHEYLQKFRKQLRQTVQKQNKRKKKGKKGKEEGNEKKEVVCSIFIAKSYSPWQIEVLEAIQALEGKTDDLNSWRKSFIDRQKELGGKKALAKYLKFGAMIMKNIKLVGFSAVSLKLSFNEEQALKNISGDLMKEFKFAEVRIIDVINEQDIPKQQKKLLANVTLGTPTVLLS